MAFVGHEFVGRKFLTRGVHGVPGDEVALALSAATCSAIGENEDVNILDKCGRTPLFHAVLENYSDIVGILLKGGARILVKDNGQRTVLHYAAERGYYGCLKIILQFLEKQRSLLSKKTVERHFTNNLSKDINGITPLHLAAKQPSSKCIQTLMKCSFNLVIGTLEDSDDLKLTPLHWAAVHGCDETLSHLLKCSPLLLPDLEGRNALHFAALSHSEMSKVCLQMLLNAFPENAASPDSNGNTPLHSAVISYNDEKVNLLLKCKKFGRNVNAVNKNHRTALHLACSRGSLDIVKSLMASGADVNLQDENGATPLHLAVKNKHNDITEMLVKNETTIESVANDGRTAFHWAAAVGSNASLMLIALNGGNTLKLDESGASALHIAAMGNHSSTIDILLKCNLDIDSKSSDGRTSLHYAAEGGFVSVVKRLLKKGASLREVDYNGKSTLHFSVIGGHLHLSQLLIEAGCVVNAKDFFGRTPLHLAAFYGFSDVLCLLLENRAYFNSKDNQGKTPLHYACERGKSSNLKAVKTLLGYRAYPNFMDVTYNRGTPLDYAVYNNDIEMIEVLMNQGAVCMHAIALSAALIIQKFWRDSRKRKIQHVSDIDAVVGLPRSDTDLTMEKAASTIQHCWRKNQKRLMQANVKLALNQASHSLYASFAENLCRMGDDAVNIGNFMKEVSGLLEDTPNTSEENDEHKPEILGDDLSSSSDSYDEVDLDNIPECPVIVRTLQDGTSVKEIEYNGQTYKLPTEEEIELQQTIIKHFCLARFMATNNIKSFTEWGRKIVAVGRNYRDHCLELGNPLPKVPLLFMKPPSSYLLEGFGPILIPRGCETLHHEVELGVVIDSTCKDVQEKDAKNHVAGYALALDMTARDFQEEAKAKGNPWTMAKCFDTALPISRFISEDEISNPADLTLWCSVNGKQRQNGTTSDMVFNIPYLISYISQYFTLEPGDLVLTGTPAGVGPVVEGDVIKCGISGICDMEFVVKKRW